VTALRSICWRVSGGRVVLRPDGSPIIAVKSPIRKITVWPRSWSWRILFSTTVCPRCRSGAVGSSPSLMRSAWPLASLRASFASQSDSTSSSSQPRSVTAIACRTASLVGGFSTFITLVQEIFLLVYNAAFAAGEETRPAGPGF
jgi:hypothetical protein